MLFGLDQLYDQGYIGSVCSYILNCVSKKGDIDKNLFYTIYTSRMDVDLAARSDHVHVKALIKLTS